jgi:acetylornithine deacetylase
MTKINARLIARLREAFQPDAALALLRRAIGTPSVTGNEAAFAALLAEELKALGAESVSAWDFAPGRPNVTALRKGQPGADTLLLVGHTDTVHVRGWSEHWAGTERESPFSGALVDGAVWGRGASDLKAGVCAILSAVRTLDRAGIALDPNLFFAFVGDEESGEEGSGISAGARALAERILKDELPKPDFTIYVEPTMLDVYVAHMGFFICDIKITGKSAYFGVPELGVDALKAANQALGALWLYSDELARGERHPLVGAGFVLPTGISGGGSIAVPGECTISLIAKIPPGVELDTVRQGMESAVRAAIADQRITLDFAYPAGRDHPIGGTPFEKQNDGGRIDRLVESIRAIRPDRGLIEAAPYWSEMPFFAALGSPGVYFAPGDIKICHTVGENVNLQDYYDGILALALYLARDPQ